MPIRSFNWLILFLKTRIDVEILVEIRMRKFQNLKLYVKLPLATTINTMPSSNVASMYSPPITRSRATKIRNDTVVSLDSEAKTKLFNYLGNSLSAVKKKQSKNKIRKRSTNHEAEHDREDRAEPDASESTKAIEEQGEKRKKLKGNHYDDVQLDGAPEGELHEVAVQDSENISPLADAATELQQILDFLKQPNWKEADCWHQRFLAVETLRAAILHHPRDIEKPL